MSIGIALTVVRPKPFPVDWKTRRYQTVVQMARVSVVSWEISVVFACQAGEDQSVASVS